MGIASQRTSRLTREGPVLAACWATVLVPSVWLLRSCSIPWLVISFVACLAGSVWLSTVRPARSYLSRMHWMMILSALGMLGGLHIDSSTTNLRAFIDLCGTAAGSGFAFSYWKTHFEYLPAMHAFMLAGGISAMVFAQWRQERSDIVQWLFDVACLLGMMAGMVLGMATFRALARWLELPWDAAALLGGMVVGMMWSMPVVASLSRLSFHPFRFRWT